MRTFTAIDGSHIRRIGLSYDVVTTADSITVDRAELQTAEAHDEFMVALACALDDLSKIRKGGRIKPRRSAPSRASWPALETK